MVDYTEMSEKRCTKHQMWLRVAATLASRSHDDRTKVGCVIMDGQLDVVLGTGYNGNYAGGPNQRDEQDASSSGMSGLIHAEINALVRNGGAVHMAAMLGKKLGIMFVTHAPCRACANTIIASGLIREVYYAGVYKLREGADDWSGVELLERAGIMTKGVHMQTVRDADLS